MKIAFTSTGKDMESKIDSRFGRTEFILVLDDDTKSLEVIDNSDVANDAHGAGPKTAQKLFELGTDVLITGNGPGGNAMSIIKKGRTDIYIGAGGKSIEQAYILYKENKLSKM